MRVPSQVAGCCTSRYCPEMVSGKDGLTPTLPRVQLPSTATRQACVCVCVCVCVGGGGGGGGGILL